MAPQAVVAAQFDNNQGGLVFFQLRRAPPVVSPEMLALMTASASPLLASSSSMSATHPWLSDIP